MFIQGHNHHIRGESGLVILNGNEIIRGGCGGKGYPSCSAREGEFFSGGGGDQVLGRRSQHFGSLQNQPVYIKLFIHLKKKKRYG